MTAPPGELVRLATGAEMRLTGDGATAVVCVNGGQARRGGGNLERVARVARAAARAALPGSSRSPRCATGSSRGSGSSACVEDARAAVDAVGAERTLLLGFSMGGAVAIAAADEPSVERRARARAVDPRPARARAAARQAARRAARLARPLAAGHPGRVAGALAARASSARARSASTGSYALIPGALHGIALRAPAGRPVPLPRAARVGAAGRGSARRRSEAGAAAAGRRRAP